MLTKARGPGRTPLSPREQEVQALLAQGCRGTETAERLGLSGETVRTHVRNAMGKLDAKTRAHAVAIAVESGVISPTSDDEQA
jgi:DNA-binding CsgD family transcriptional regulator